MNCLFLSCHAALEYYMSQLFQKINVKIALSDMDLGNPERPFIAGYRELTPLQQFSNERHHNQSWQPNDLRHIDFIYMMNFHNIDTIANYYLQFRKPLYIHLFGQYNIRLVHALIDLACQSSLINLVCYSQTEYNIYRRLSYDNARVQKHLYYIPFGISTEEFTNWTGKTEIVFTTCNDIHNRGKACNWYQYQKISKSLPSLLTGRNTEEVGGKGLLPYNALKKQYQEARCYLSMGTIPAPYTLTPVEAMMTGCPTVIYDNGMGITDENILSVDGSLGLVSKDIGQIQSYLNKLLSDFEFAQTQSNLVRKKAIEVFDIKLSAQKWFDILRRV